MRRHSRQISERLPDADADFVSARHFFSQTDHVLCELASPFPGSRRLDISSELI